MPLVKGKVYNVEEVLALLNDLESDDNVHISSEGESDEGENILDTEQENPQQEVSPEDEQYNVNLLSSSQHLLSLQGVTNISNIDAISTCTAVRAFSLPPPNVSDSNEDLFTDVVTDDVPSQSYLTSNNIDFCISEGHTRSGKLFYGEPSQTAVTTRSMCTSTPKRAKTRGGRRGQGGLRTRGSAKHSIPIKSRPSHKKSATSNYTDLCRDHRRFPFSGKSKVCCNPTDPSSPLSVLKTFLTDELMDNITAHTIMLNFFSVILILLSV